MSHFKNMLQQRKKCSLSGNHTTGGSSSAAVEAHNCCSNDAHYWALNFLFETRKQKITHTVMLSNLLSQQFCYDCMQGLFLLLPWWVVLWVPSCWFGHHRKLSGSLNIFTESWPFTGAQDLIHLSHMLTEYHITCFGCTFSLLMRHTALFCYGLSTKLCSWMTWMTIEKQKRERIFQW